MKASTALKKARKKVSLVPYNLEYECLVWSDVQQAWMGQGTAPYYVSRARASTATVVHALVLLGLSENDAEHYSQKYYNGPLLDRIESSLDSHFSRGFPQRLVG